MKAVVWASCWLAAPNKVFDAIAEMQKYLAGQDVELVFMGDPSIGLHYPTIKVIDVPFYISEMGRRYSSYAAVVPHLQSSVPVAELIAIDQAWGVEIPPLEAELLILRANAFWEKAFAIMQPSAMLSWGATAPMARMMFNIARRFQRPAFVLERGLMEDTLSYSLVGQGMLSNFNTSLSLVEPDFQDPQISSTWNAIQTYYASVADRHYPEMNRSPDDVALSHFENDPRPRVLYLGSHDMGSGASFSPELLGDLQGTWVKSSSEGAVAVENVLAEMHFKGALWIKPHGASHFDVSSTESPFPKTIMANTNVYSLIDQADVCVTLTSSTQVLSLIKGKPVVTLGNGQFTGRGIFYEAASHDELFDALQQAIAKTGWETRVERGQALIAAGYGETHISLGSGAPTRFNLSDFSKLIARFAHYTPAGLTPASERISAFINFCSSALDTRMLREAFGTSDPFQQLREKSDIILRYSVENEKLKQDVVDLDVAIEKARLAAEVRELFIRSKDQAINNLEKEKADFVGEITLIRVALDEMRKLNGHLEEHKIHQSRLIFEAEEKLANACSEKSLREEEIATIRNILEELDERLHKKMKAWKSEKENLSVKLNQFLKLSVLSCGKLPALRGRRVTALKKALIASELFDGPWYASSYLKDEDTEKPVDHFLRYGLDSGLAPNELLK